MSKTTRHFNGDGTVTTVEKSAASNGGTKTVVSKGPSPTWAGSSGSKIVSVTRTDRHGNSSTNRR